MDNNCSEKIDPQEETVLLEDISLLETLLENKYNSLGREIFNLADIRLKEINSIVDKMIMKKENLAKIKGYMICENCLAKNSSKDKYCGTCGKPINVDTV